MKDKLKKKSIFSGKNQKECMDKACKYFDVSEKDLYFDVLNDGENGSDFEIEVSTRKHIDSKAELLFNIKSDLIDSEIKKIDLKF